MIHKSFELVHIKELPSRINRDIEINAEVIRNSGFSFLVVFQHQDGNDTVGLHLAIRYVTSEDKVILEEGASFIARIGDWKEMKHDNDSLRDNETILAFVDYAIAFVSGMVYRHTSGTILNSAFIPYIDATAIKDDIRFEEIPEKA